MPRKSQISLMPCASRIPTTNRFTCCILKGWYRLGSGPSSPSSTAPPCASVALISFPMHLRDHRGTVVTYSQHGRARRGSTSPAFCTKVDVTFPPLFFKNYMARNVQHLKAVHSFFAAPFPESRCAWCAQPLIAQRIGQVSFEDAPPDLPYHHVDCLDRASPSWEYLHTVCTLAEVLPRLSRRVEQSMSISFAVSRRKRRYHCRVGAMCVVPARVCVCVCVVRQDAFSSKS